MSKSRKLRPVFQGSCQTLQKSEALDMVAVGAALIDNATCRAGMQLAERRCPVGGLLPN